MNKIEIVTVLKKDDVGVEDSGAYKEICIESDDACLYFRICSYDEMELHEKFNDFIGKKIKLSIAEIEQ